MKQPRPWFVRKLVVGLGVAVMLLACSGSPSDDTGTAPGAVPGKAPGNNPGGVYTFGQTVTFKDTSTLTVGKPVSFTRDPYAAGGEQQKVFLKFTSTFTNRTKEIFDPTLTTASVTAGGVEGESVFQQGLDAPDNKVLPGKSVTWQMGYGVQSSKDLQLQVTIGFLDYGTVIFTS